MTLLENVTSNLRLFYESAGKAQEVEILKSVLIAERGAIPYSTIAQELCISEGAARVAVQRIRKSSENCFAQRVPEPFPKVQIWMKNSDTLFQF